METFRLNGTDLTISRTGFGGLPIQRVGFDTARTILRQAYDSGITFFDTARGYSDSEEKIGYSLADVRANIVIATKTGGPDKATLLKHLETSLKNLRTDYVDILQLHNPSSLSDPDDPDTAYAGLVEAKKKGMVRFIGMSNHKLDVALQAVESGLYSTIQFPLSHISAAEDLALIDKCKDKQVGIIAMKALCGGLITNTKAAFAFLRQYENVVPIWGIQRVSELEDILGHEQQLPALNDEQLRAIEKDRQELAGDFCRGCGYCLPCAEDIPIPTAARMAMLLKRAPTAGLVSEAYQERMAKVENCTECGQCRERCPYHLDTPRLIKKMYKDYQAYLNQ